MEQPETLLENAPPDRNRCAFAKVPGETRRSERGYLEAFCDAGRAKNPKSLRGHFGQFYDVRKVRNSDCARPFGSICMNCSHLPQRARTRWVTERIASARAKDR